MCVCLFMYVCMPVCMCVYALCVCVYVCMTICVLMYVYGMPLSLDELMYDCVDVFMCSRMYACMYACAYVCMYVCMHINGRMYVLMPAHMYV